MRLLGVNDMIWEGEKAAPALSCTTTTTMNEVPLSKASICSVYCTFIVTAAGVNVQNCPLKIKEQFYKFQLVKNSMSPQR